VSEKRKPKLSAMNLMRMEKLFRAYRMLDAMDLICGVSASQVHLTTEVMVEMIERGDVKVTSYPFAKDDAEYPVEFSCEFKGVKYISLMDWSEIRDNHLESYIPASLREQYGVWRDQQVRDGEGGAEVEI